MLVIVSDLHLTDGTSGKTIDSSAFRIFRQRLCDLAYDASYQKNGVYRPIESVDLILLGDILDPIRSTKWLRKENGKVESIRPWHDSQSPEFINKIGLISRAIIKRNADSLAVLKGLNDGKTITIPPAQNGKPANVAWNTDSPDRVPVAVNIHYMVGNHDWFYHLPGKEYDEIRQTVIDAIGLVPPAANVFPHSPAESSVLTEIMRQHKVFARHGDVFDAINFEQNRNISSIGDVIVVELLNRFPELVTEQLGQKLPRLFTFGLRELDNVRPNIIVPLWINNLLRLTCSDQPALVKEVHGLWNDLVNQFFKLDFVKQHDTYNPFDEINKLQSTLRFSEDISFESLGQLVKKFFPWLGDEGSYAKNALQEESIQNRTAQFVVYGHTHRTEIVPLDSIEVRGQSLDQIYFNSGTWRRVHELARLIPNKETFVSHNVMTYLAFFKRNERKGRPFEYWSGALGIDE